MKSWFCSCVMELYSCQWWQLNVGSCWPKLFLFIEVCFIHLPQIFLLKKIIGFLVILSCCLFSTIFFQFPSIKRPESNLFEKCFGLSEVLIYNQGATSSCAKHMFGVLKMCRALWRYCRIELFMFFLILTFTTKIKTRCYGRFLWFWCLKKRENKKNKKPTNPNLLIHCL